jgi:hypothetical protein
VITLPNESTVVGLKNNKAKYVSKTNNVNGNLSLDEKFLTTKFVPGVYGKSDPRQDAIIPMNIYTDTSTYIVLFEDRGDAAIEKSYARLGSNIDVRSVDILPTDGKIKGEEYRVSVKYLLAIGSIKKETIIPVVEGHFDPKNTTTTGDEPVKNIDTPLENNDSTPPVLPVACTMEAKECPDGTYVSRSGPKCEFALCPSPQQATGTVINRRIYNNGVYITPIDIIEDSRCPAGASCIWAGRLRIKVKLERESQVSEPEIDLGVNSIVFMGKRVTLQSATPTPRPAGEIAFGQYTFEFSVTNAKTTN